MWLLVSKTHCFGTVRLGLLCSRTKGIWQPNNNNQESNLARAQSPASVVVVGSTQAWSMRNFLGKNAAVAASSSSWRSNSSNASPSFQRATLAKAENQPRLLAYVKREGLRPLTSSSCTAWHIGLLYRKPLSRTPPARSCLGDGRLGGRRQQPSLLSTRVWDTDHGHRIPADTAHNFAPSQRLPLPRLVLIRSHCALLSRKSKTNCLTPATDFFSTSILLWSSRCSRLFWV